MAWCDAQALRSSARRFRYAQLSRAAFDGLISEAGRQEIGTNIGSVDAKPGTDRREPRDLLALLTTSPRRRSQLLPRRSATKAQALQEIRDHQLGSLSVMVITIAKRVS